jgi:hypothetical protein
LRSNTKRDDAAALPILERIRSLAQSGEVLFSSHALEEAMEDQIAPVDVLASLVAPECLEDYPDYWRGPCCLALHWIEGEAVHAVRGIPKGADSPAYLVTTYRPDEARWLDARTSKA